MVLCFLCLSQAANNELNGWLVRPGSEVLISLFKILQIVYAEEITCF